MFELPPKYGGSLRVESGIHPIIGRARPLRALAVSNLELAEAHSIHAHPTIGQAVLAEIHSIA